MKYFIRAAVFLVAIMTVQVGAAHAAQYYVDSTYTGSTSNGALATPWKTLSQVQGAALVAGDIVSFKRGTTYSGTLTINRSGAAGNPITFNAYGTGANPKFVGDYNATTNTSNSITKLVYTYNRSYLVFDGIDITDPAMDPNNRTLQSKIERAFYLDGSSSNIIIKNCNISLVGIGAYFVGPNNTMQNCTIENMRMVKNTNDGPPPGNDDDYGANPLVISSSGNKILNNKFIGCWANSYDYVYDGGGIDFYGDGASNNYVAYNLITDCNGALELGSGNAGTMTNNVIAYNLMINNGSTIYVSNSGTYNVNVTGLSFLNNIILETQPFRLSESAMFGFRSTPTAANSLILKNNIIQLYGTIDVARNQWSTPGALVHENNVYKLGSGSVLNFTQNPSELITTTNYWTSTTSSDPTTWNFRPIAGSVIVDRGTNVGLTTDFAGTSVPQGASPDAGIYEYVTTVTPDTTAPTVSLTAPTAGATVSGTAATVSANASDNVGVVGVQFKLDGANLGTEDTTAPYSITWNTTTATNGAHTLTAVARDATGNTSTATNVSVTVSNTVPDTTAPTVAFSSPAAGSTISGTVTVSADATDNVGVASVAFNLDGLLHTTDTTAPYSATWISTGIADGSHTWTAVARDAAGNTSTTATRSFTVSNTTTGYPSVPTGLTALATSPTQVELSWAPSATGSAGGYEIYRNGVNITHTIGAGATTYVDTGLTPSTTYTYAVSAYHLTSTWESAQTALVAVTTPAVVAMYKTTAKVNVRANPSVGVTGTILGTQAKGAIGTVIGGPVSNNGYVWYNLDFPFAPDGWVASRNLVAYNSARTGTTTSKTTSVDASLTASSSLSSLEALQLLQQASRATSSTEALRLIEQAKQLMR